MILPTRTLKGGPEMAAGVPKFFELTATIYSEFRLDNYISYRYIIG
jgi:hypothetical protein